MDYSKAPSATTTSLTIEADRIDANGHVHLDGVAPYTIPPDIGAARCYSYGGILTGVAPDGTQMVAEHLPGDVVQSSVATFRPDIETSVNAQLIGSVPAELSDRIHIFHGIPGRSYAGRTVLYGPFGSDEDAQQFSIADDGTAQLSAPTSSGSTAEATDNKSAPANSPERTTQQNDTSVAPIGERRFEGIFDDNGEAHINAEPIRVEQFGYYVWVEELFERPDGSHANPAERQRRPPETQLTLNPTISTEISDQLAERGSTISDEAKISGLQWTVGTRPVEWSTTVELYGPIEPNGEGRCDDLDWSQAPVAYSEDIVLNKERFGYERNVTLTAIGRYTIPRHGSRGCYSYGETLHGTAPDGSKITSVHAPGDPRQTTLVPPAGKIISGENTEAPYLPKPAIALGILSIIALASASIFYIRQ